MKPLVFEKGVTVPVGVDSLWDWHTRTGAFQRLTPPWQTIVPLQLPEPMEVGREGLFHLVVGPFHKAWRARIEEVAAPHKFVDTQLEGPFGYWRHEHVMTAFGTSQSNLVDRVSYLLPAGAGRLPIARRIAEGELERLFRFRHDRMLADLERFKGEKPGTGKTVLVTGSTGLIGSRLVPFLKTLGYAVRGLTRGEGHEELFNWDPARGWLDPDALEGVHAVIHLAGENIASGRWTPARKERILKSRIDGTRCLVEAMGRMSEPPEVLVTASGVNIYESGVSGSHDEQSGGGTGFLGEVCRQWEAEAMRAEALGIRTVCLRTGVVLDPAGGALGKMLPAFRLGVGGPVGTGQQGFPWIGMDDLLDIYEQAVRDDCLRGPVNAVHPQQISQEEFSRTLGRVLRRPAYFRIPSTVVKLLFGKMGEEALLADLKVTPGVLKEHDHRFRHAGLFELLAFILGKPLH